MPLELIDLVKVEIINSLVPWAIGGAIGCFAFGFASGWVFRGLRERAL